MVPAGSSRRAGSGGCRRGSLRLERRRAASPSGERRRRDRLPEVHRVSFDDAMTSRAAGGQVVEHDGQRFLGETLAAPNAAQQLGVAMDLSQFLMAGSTMQIIDVLSD